MFEAKTKFPGGVRWRGGTAPLEKHIYAIFSGTMGRKNLRGSNGKRLSDSGDEDTILTGFIVISLKGGGGLGGSWIMRPGEGV